MGLSSRQRKVLVAYLDRKIIEMPDGSWVVQGRRLRKGGRAPSWVVHIDPETDGLVCPCEGYKEQFTCKHVEAVDKFRTEGEPRQGYDNLDDSKRTTYPQDWARYRIYRRVLMAALPLVVRALADHIFPVVYNPGRTAGRPRIPIRDLIVCVSLRSIHQRSGDLVQGYVDDLHDRKLLYRRPMLHVAPPATSSITMNMRKEHLAVAFHKLIQASGEVFRGEKVRIGIDGSEFNTPVLTEQTKRNTTTNHRADKHADRTVRGKPVPGKAMKVKQGAKKGQEVHGDEKADNKLRLINVTTVKLHAAVDVDTGFIVDCSVTAGKSGEAEQAFALLEEIRKTRFLSAFCADKGYLAEYLVSFCQENNIEIAVPTKSNTSTDGDTILAEYARSWNNRTEETKELYARRGICESAFSRLKRLTDEDLRGLKLGSQRVELLSHVLVANLAQLIQKYVYGEIDLAWLDARTRAILDPARNAVMDLPPADRTPRYRDGLPQDIGEDVA